MVLSLLFQTAFGEVITFEWMRQNLSKLPLSTVLVDVRDASEFEHGHIQGAVSIPLSGIDTAQFYALLPQKGRVILYCTSGVRSKLAWERIKEAGLRVDHIGYFHAKVICNEKKCQVYRIK